MLIGKRPLSRNFRDQRIGLLVRPKEEALMNLVGPGKITEVRAEGKRVRVMHIGDQGQELIRFYNTGKDGEYDLLPYQDDNALEEEEGEEPAPMKDSLAARLFVSCRLHLYLSWRLTVACGFTQ